MFALRILIDAVQVAMKLHSLKIDDGEEKKLCRVGIRRFGVDDVRVYGIKRPYSEICPDLSGH